MNHRPRGHLPLHLQAILVVLPLVALLLPMQPAHGITITQLFSPAQFTSFTILSNDFETSKDIPGITFDATASLQTGTEMGGATPHSGLKGLREPGGSAPLTATLASPSREVGLYFGNDPPTVSAFPVFLSVYDAAGVLLGTVTVWEVARNRHVDHFIGLRSDTDFKRVDLLYSPAIGALDMFIDDFTVGAGDAAPVPEPAGLGVLAAALVAAALRWRRRPRSAPGPS